MLSRNPWFNKDDQRQERALARAEGKSFPKGSGIDAWRKAWRADLKMRREHTVVTASNVGDKYQEIQLRNIEDGDDVLEGLTSRERTICEMKVHGFTGKEIAEKLGVSQGAISQSLNSARRKILAKGICIK